MRCTAIARGRRRSMKIAISTWKSLKAQRTPSPDHGVGRNRGTVCNSISETERVVLLTDGVGFFFHARALGFHSGGGLVAAGNFGNGLENLGGRFFIHV